MAAVEAVLACVGLLALIGVVIAWRSAARPTEQPPEADLAAPYREGLQAAIQMDVVAQGLEQQLYAEAMRRVDSGRRDES